MKKIFLLLAILLASFSLVACGSDSELVQDLRDGVWSRTATWDEEGHEFYDEEVIITLEFTSDEVTRTVTFENGHVDETTSSFEIEEGRVNVIILDGDEETTLRLAGSVLNIGNETFIRQ